MTRGTIPAGKRLRRAKAVALPLGRRLQPGENGAGFVSGLAARNRASTARGFCAVFSESFGDVLSGDSDTIQHMARRGGEEPLRLSGAIPVWDQNAAVVWGHAVRKSDLMAPAVMRFCPACLESDVAAAPHLPPGAAVVQRFAWEVAGVSVCPVHDCLIVSTGFPEGLHGDFAAVYRQLREQRSPLLVPVARKASGFDAFIHGLLHRPSDQSGFWVGQELYEVTRSCLMIGGAALNGRGFRLRGMDDTHIAAACSKGFELLDAPDPLELDAVLDNLVSGAKRTGRSAPGATKSFGKLGIWISQYSEGPEFYRLRSLLADFLVRRKLVRLGDRWILGLPAPKRSYESLITLALEFETSERLLRQALLAGGHIGDEVQGVVDSQVFVEVEKVREFLTAFAERLNKREVADYLGVDERCVPLLVGEDLIQPPIFRSSSDGKPLRFFSRSQVRDFRARAFAMALKGPPPPDALNMLFACRVVQRPLPKLLVLLMEGRLKRVWKTTDRVEDMLVDVDEINAILRPPRPPVYSVEECKKLLRVSPKNIYRMMDRGDLPPVVVHRPSGIGTMRAVPVAAVEEFSKRWITATELSEKYRIGTRGMVPRLSSFAIEPVLTTEQVGVPVYDRRKITAFFAGQGMARYKRTYYVNNR